MRLKLIPSPVCIGCGDAVPVDGMHCAACMRAIAALERAANDVALHGYRVIARRSGAYMIYGAGGIELMDIEPRDADWPAALEGRAKRTVKLPIEKIEKKAAA